MAAFGLTRLKWKLSSPTLSLILLGVMIPIHSTLIPLFTMFNKWGITNRYIALILPYVAFALPTSIFILSGFMSTFPKEIEEAVVIDGCGMAGVFWKIIFPMSKTPIATISIYNFVSMWNELMFALIFLSDPDKTTLPVSLTRFRGQYSTNWTVQLAAVVIMVIPSIVVYMFLNDRIIESMTIGSVKG
jgi:raffinose/stachyose/melibiose transport system permease protein